MINDSDDKVTDGLVLKYFRIAKQNRLSAANEKDSAWNGQACDWCDQGFICYWKKVRTFNEYRYHYIARCPKCDCADVQKLMSAGCVRTQGIATGSGGFQSPSCKPSG